MHVRNIAFAFVLCVLGCGGGDDAPTGEPADIPATTVTSPVTGMSPIAFGQVFRPGDWPAGQKLADLQLDVLSTWPDGSAKIALVSGVVETVANQPLPIELRPGAGVTGAPLTTDKLKTVTAAIDASGIGTATWAEADWAAPFSTWVEGPAMASWIYRKPIGADPTLVAWLEVRAWSDGSVELLPWIENGYLLVPNPTSKSATYTFSVNGTSRFSAAIDLPNHARTVLLDGSALAHWVGDDRTISVHQDPAYMMATELVPTYRAVTPSSALAVTTLAKTYQPLAAGNIIYEGDSMAASGYQTPIGLLPEHDVLYLVAEADVYPSVVRNGFSAGRYAIHYRDEKTNRPPLFSQYPDLGFSDGSGFKDNGSSRQYTPMVSGTRSPQWDCAHSPSVGYMAYLLTARFYFMEEVQLAATANHLGKGANVELRDGAKGLVMAVIGAWQTRSMAWQWRTLIQALTVTPDADTALRTELVNAVQANIDDLHARYVEQPNNPYGWVKPGEAYNVGLGDTIQFGAIWQQDFVTATFGWALAMKLPIDDERSHKLAEFFAWKAKSVVMRFGAESDWWYVNAAPYVMTITPAAAPDFETGTGPWYPTSAEAYAASYAPPREPPWLGHTEGELAGEILPGDRAMWGNLQPALAYAVRFEVPGAAEAYARMTSATNWPALRDAFNVAPVWSVKPPME